LLKKLRSSHHKRPLDLWERVNRFRRNEAGRTDQAKQTNGDPVTNDGAAEQVADMLFPVTEAAASVPSSDRTPWSHNDPLDATRSITINNDEIMRAQKGLRGKKYIGPDGIKFQTFNKSFEFISDILCNIARMSYALCHVPSHCHNTVGNAIPKKQSNKFRIVHVATPLAVFLELIALNRFEFTLDMENCRDPNQFGFTKRRGRHDLIGKLIETVVRHRLGLKAKLKGATQQQSAGQTPSRQTN